MKKKILIVFIALLMTISVFPFCVHAEDEENYDAVISAPRLRVADIRIAGRSTMGVIVFRLDKNEKVVSAECITDIGEPESDQETDSITAPESPQQTDTSCETGDCV